MKDPNMVFLYMFDWFIKKYGKTTTKDREANWQRMAVEWHPAKGFEPLATRLFIGALYTSAARYPMRDCDIIEIGLRIIKCCGMYSKEYKIWIAREHESPPIIKMISTPRRSIGQEQLRSSTRRRHQPHNMAMPWLQSTTKRRSHRTPK